MRKLLLSLAVLASVVAMAAPKQYDCKYWVQKSNSSVSTSDALAAGTMTVQAENGVVTMPNFFNSGVAVSFSFGHSHYVSGGYAYAVEELLMEDGVTEDADAATYTVDAKSDYTMTFPGANGNADLTVTNPVFDGYTFSDNGTPKCSYAYLMYSGISGTTPNASDVTGVGAYSRVYFNFAGNDGETYRVIINLYHNEFIDAPVKVQLRGWTTNDDYEAIDPCTVGVERDLTYCHLGFWGLNSFPGTGGRELFFMLDENGYIQPLGKNSIFGIPDEDYVWWYLYDGGTVTKLDGSEWAVGYPLVDDYYSYVIAESADDIYGEILLDDTMFILSTDYTEDPEPDYVTVSIMDLDGQTAGPDQQMLITGNNSDGWTIASFFSAYDLSFKVGKQIAVAGAEHPVLTFDITSSVDSWTEEGYTTSWLLDNDGYAVPALIPGANGTVTTFNYAAIEFDDNDPTEGTYIEYLGDLTYRATLLFSGQETEDDESDMLYRILSFTWIGTEEPELGVTTVEADANAPVEYYTLQGVRVANPTSGLYIRRQGHTATKVTID